MCGIFGAWGEGVTERVGRDALATLAHRGPDGRGHELDVERGLFFGQTRLSIIDLSEGGRQPMENEDGSLLLAFNGEVYNHAELRSGLVERGHVFRGSCDAEVVLHLYEEKGLALLDDLVGMFAFALFDRRADKLVLARDRLGIKPLYWYRDERLVAFASELKAIRGFPGVDVEPDPTAYWDFLTYRFVPAPKTIYRRARKVPAGSLVEIERGGVRERRWWDVSFEPEPWRTLDDSLDELEALANEVVRDHLVSDVEVGAFLSSGVDSTLVTALAARAQGRAPRTFTIAFPGRRNDEADAAGRTAELLGAEREVGTFGAEEAREAGPLYFELFDEPFADHAAMPTLQLARLAARRVKVVLSGDGGDETHAGYGRYGKLAKRERLYAVLDRVPLLAHAAALGPLRRAPWARDLAEEPCARRHAFHAGLGRETKRLLFTDVSPDLRDYDDYWLLRGARGEDASPLARAQRIDLTTMLPDGHLTKVDRASMRCGLEVRVPLLDHRMVELACRLPDQLRRAGDEGKLLLRRLVARVLPGYDPGTPKLGFSVPIRRLVEREGLYRLRGDLEVPGAFRIGAREVERTLSPKRNAMELWQLWVLESFLAQHAG